MLESWQGSQSCLIPVTLNWLSLPLHDRCASFVITSLEPPDFIRICAFVDPVGNSSPSFLLLYGTYFPILWSAVCFNSAAFGFSNLFMFEQLSCQFSFFFFFPFGRYYVVNFSSILCIFVEHFLRSVSLRFPSANLWHFLREMASRKRVNCLSVFLRQQIITSIPKQCKTISESNRFCAKRK